MSTATIQSPASPLDFRQPVPLSPAVPLPPTPSNATWPNRIFAFFKNNWQTWVLIGSMMGIHLSVQVDPNATNPSIVVVVPSGPLASGANPDMSPLAKEVAKINKALELVRKHKFKTFQEAYDSLQ